MLPLAVQLFAAPGSALSAGPGPRRIRGSMRASRMLDEVVSVARPASSEGGSAPSAMRKKPALLLEPDLPVAAGAVKATITARAGRPAQIIRGFRILLLPPSEVS